MKEQDSLYRLTFKLEMPGENAGDQDRERRNRGYGNVVVGCIGEAAAVGCPVHQTKNNGRDVQRDGEMDPYDMLRVLRQNCCFPIERMCHCILTGTRVS